MPDDDRFKDDLEGRAFDLTQMLAQRHFGTIRHIFDESIVHASQTATLYAGSAWGGVWKTPTSADCRRRPFSKYALSLEVAQDHYPEEAT